MSFLPFAVAAWLFLVGLYGIVSSRNLVRAILSLTIVQSATYVVLLAVGYRTGGQAPIFADIPQLTKAVDPVVQVLVLTDIVIEATVTAMLLAARRPGPQALRKPRPARPPRSPRLAAPEGAASHRDAHRRAPRRGAADGRRHDRRPQALDAAAGERLRRRRRRAGRRHDVRDPPRARVQASVRLLDGWLAAEPHGDDRDLILGRSDRRRDGHVLGDSGDGGDRVLVAVFRCRRRPVSRADAAVHGRDGGLLPDRRPVQPARVLRADGHRGLRADRVQDRGAWADPGRDQLRDHQQRRRVRDLHRRSLCCTRGPGR